jgi:Immunity protein Imm1
MQIDDEQSRLIGGPYASAETAYNTYIDSVTDTYSGGSGGGHNMWRVIGDKAKWLLVDSGRGEIGTPTNVVELEETLKNLSAIASAPNAIAVLASPNGDTLSVGISNQVGPPFPEQGEEDQPPGVIREPLACANYTQEDDTALYLYVVGDKELSRDEGVAVFRYCGEWTEIPRRNCVPVPVMIEIAKAFFTTGELPEWIDWEDV